MAAINLESEAKKNTLVAFSKEIGFQDLKIARYDILKNEIENYLIWLGNSYNSDMKWMEKNIEKKLDPRLILPNTQSVITLAYNYFTGNLHPANISSNIGKISRYALGSDYHEIVHEKLFLIEKKLKHLFPVSNSKSYVDTGPVLEKQWAVKSGLGWQGKNSLIINKNFGSYFFIGIIFTDIMLPFDNEVKDYCGSCTKCIDNCPTNAIIADKVVDSKKCISYWTIEAKPDQNIPDRIASNSQNWIYGCDICQEVCPWNKNKPEITSEKEFFSRYEKGILEKNDILNMEQEKFSSNFKKSPIKRLKLAGLKRNALQILK